jgi:hypothetical protein
MSSSGSCWCGGVGHGAVGGAAIVGGVACVGNSNGERESYNLQQVDFNGHLPVTSAIMCASYLLLVASIASR